MHPNADPAGHGRLVTRGVIYSQYLCERADLVDKQRRAFPLGAAAIVRRKLARKK